MSKRVDVVVPPDKDMLLDLFSKYNHSLRMFIRNTVKCEQTADEIAQETYVRFAAAKNKEEIDFPKAYLFRTARNISLDFLRRKGLRVVDDNVEVDADAVLSSAPSPEDDLIHAQAKKRLENALKELPLRTRQVFYYRRYEGLTVKHVAAKMGISERLVYKNMEDAMQHLAIRLKEKS
ncbi:MAG: RNA polymerase sigma factor [Kordiimonas sp.]